MVNVAHYLDKPAVFKVPLKLTGTPKGVDLGGDLHVVSSSVQVKGCPLDIPDHVEVNIAALDRGDSMKFADIAIPEKVEMLNDGSKTFVAVH